MANKFVITVTPYWLLVLGRLIGEIKNELTQSITYYEPIRECLSTLSVYQDTKDSELNTKDFEFLGRGADSLLSEFSKKYSQEHASLNSEDTEFLKLTIATWEERLREISKNWFICYPNTHLDTSKLRKGVKAFLSRDEFNTLETL